MRRRHFDDVERNKSNETSKAKTLDEAEDDQHGNVHRACRDRGADHNYDGGNSDGLFPSDGIAQPTLANCPERCSGVEKAVEDAQDTGCV